MSSFDFSGVAFNTPFAPTLVYSSSSSSQQQQLDADAGDATTHGDAISSNANGGRTRAKGKRAPSYIPRPPNAFILFRSSFIRSQNVPGRVEGNHSTLSKIIGKYWHALPATERARWEDKARAAQAEHRRRYPDWRFRPGNGKVRLFFPARFLYLQQTFLPSSRHPSLNSRPVLLSLWLVSRLSTTPPLLFCLPLYLHLHSSPHSIFYLFFYFTIESNALQ
ncbi:high mobility group box domain-containing protein [Mycena crocata]|nr:high mobility group box domain-containing protein [Mycena crocata]